jgi:hypothetical protein
MVRLIVQGRFQPPCFGQHVLNDPEVNLRSVCLTEEVARPQRGVESDFYFRNNVLSWSKGERLWKQFVVETPIADVQFCSFDSTAKEPGSRSLIVDIVILDANGLTVFAANGETYKVPLPTRIEAMQPLWNGHGLLLRCKERDSNPPFLSLSHHLAEVKPVQVLNHTTNEDEYLVFGSLHRPIVLTWNQVTGLHSLWRVEV